MTTPTDKEPKNEKFIFDNLDDTKNIRKIINEHQEKSPPKMKSLSFFGALAGISVIIFVGSFLLGKSFFQNRNTVVIENKRETQELREEELIELKMPEEEVLAEIEALDQNETVVKVATPPVKTAAAPIAAPVETAGAVIKQELEKKLAYKVIAGSYQKEANALVLKRKLATAGINAFIVPIQVKTQEFYRVQAGAFATKQQAKSLCQKLKKKFAIDAFCLKK